MGLVSASMCCGSFYSAGILLGACFSSIASKSGVLKTIKSSFSVSLLAGASTFISMYTLSNTRPKDLKPHQIIGRIAFVFFTTVFISPKLSKKLSNHYHVEYLQSLFLMLNGITWALMVSAIETMVNDRKLVSVALEKTIETLNEKH